MSKTSKIILGIDPGTIIMGIGIIEVNGNCATLISMDAVKFSSKTDAYTRLQLIHEKVVQVVKSCCPNELAIEAPFYGKNVQSMLKLGRAQGVAIAAAMQAGIPVIEYSPRKVKQSITGNGNADKMQVLKMLQRILNFTEQPNHMDATDAVAVALCHHFQGAHTGAEKKSDKAGNWKEFLQKNPHRKM